MLSLRMRFDRLAKFFHLESWIRLLALCVLVGVAAGLIGILFDQGLHYLSVWLLHGVLYRIETGPVFQLFLLILIPCAGLAAAGAVALKWGPEARGGGVDAVIHAFHRKQGVIRSHIPWLKGICTILTIGSGGSAGKEGPTTQIGAGIGSTIGARLGLSVRDRRILMLAGCAGGLGAVLRTPLGGALFAAEVLYRDPDFEHDAVIPGIICSVTAYSVFTAVLGYQPLLGFDASSAQALRYPSAGGNMLGELLHYALLSLLCALAAFLVVKTLRFIKLRVFARLPVSETAKPALGGLALGALAAVMLVTRDMEPYQLLGEGQRFLNEVVADVMRPGGLLTGGNAFPIGMLVLAIACRIVATSLTIGSGASGGLLFPVILIGGLTGAFYAKAWQEVPLPDWLTLTPEARGGMIMVAMAGLFCGCNKTPIAALVMVSEMTGSYGLVVPLMLCCASTYLLTTSFTIEDEQVPGIADSPAHRGDFQVNVLEGIKVRDAITDRIKPEPIPADLPFNQVLERIKHSTATSYPIVDHEGCLIGLFSLNDIRQIMNEQAVGRLVVAGDLGTTNVPTVTMETNLGDALSHFTQKNLDQLPVVAETSSRTKSVERPTRRIERPRGVVGTKRVVAMLTRHDLISAYRKRLQELQKLEVQESSGSNVFEQAQLAAAGTEEDLVFLEEAKPPSEPARDASRPELDLLKEPGEEKPKPPSDGVES